MATARKLAFLLVIAAASLSAAVNPQLLGLAMPDARVFAGIDVSQIKSSQFGIFLLNQFPPKNDQHMDGLIAATGFDPRNDIAQILIASPGGPNNRGLAIVQGTFDPARIAEFARSVGTGITPYGGVNILGPSAPQTTGGHNGVLAVLSNSLAVLGDIDSVKAAIDRAARPSAPKSDAVTQANQLSERYQAWVVSLVPLSEYTGAQGTIPAGSPLKGDALRSIQTVIGGVNFNGAVQANATATTATPQDATSLADVVRFFLSFAQFGQQTPQNAAARALASSLQVAAQGTALNLTFSMPETQVEELILSAQPKPKP